MSWFYQPLPLASTFSVTDVDEALTGEEFETEHGTLTQSASALLSGQVSASGQGSVTIVDDEEQLQGQEADVEQGSLSVNNLVVRLRSRKVGGTSTAENILQSQAAAVQQGNPVKVLSVLLGGTGATVSQQSFASKSVARLLTGQERTTHQGTVTYVQQGGGGLPAWVQLPTQVDEQNFYDTIFITGGKDVAWEWTSGDKTGSGQGFATTAPAGTDLLPPSHDIHGDTEADDLWNHYQQWKRTGSTTNFNWAQAWRDYYCDPVDGYLDDIHDSGQPTICEHYYGQGLVMWGMERNDLEARNTALAIAADMEPFILALTPGTTNVSFSESRRYARMLLVMNYIVMMEPITRWVTNRNHILECWLQSPGWRDTTNSNIVIGGNHFAGRFNGPFNNAYDQGYRHNSAFGYALHTEALWLSYKMTGRTDIRDMLIQMGRFVLHYAWNPSHINAMCGSRWGFAPDGSHWHMHLDTFDSAGNTIPLQTWTDPTRAPTDNYEASNINTLVYAYKLTGETAFLARAREHLRQATCYGAATGNQLKLAQDEVHFYMDTQRNSDLIYFNYNKGMLQYAAHIFENGGNVIVEPSATWQPPYPVPTSPGQVVKIAGGVSGGVSGIPDATTAAHQGGDTSPSQWPTNVFADVRPPEVGTPAFANQMLWGGDTRNKFIESYSQGGAMVIAGSGGHKGTPVYGAALFDFADGRWKRVWTTQGDPGNDNVTIGNVDLRTGTTTHGCSNLERDNWEWYINEPASGHDSQECWNHTHWPTMSMPAGMKTAVPIQANPRDQFWEVSRTWSSSQVDKTGIHATQLSETDFNFGATQNGRFVRTGYITECNTFHPPPAGTLEPTQSEIPAPSHVWENYYELKPEEGGGPKGSIICGVHQNIGYSGTTVNNWSHRFDLHTGIWHEFSVNAPFGTTSGVPGVSPWTMPGAIAGAQDPGTDTVPRRAFMIPKKLGDSGGRVNYMNLNDRQWRHFQPGSGGINTALLGNTEAMTVDPDRRLLLVSAEISPYIVAFDLQTLGQTGTAEPTPSHGLGGWKIVPYDDIPGTQSSPPFVSATVAASAFPHGGQFRQPWRYYPPNGKFYRINARSMTDNASPPYPTLTALQRLTPPAIVSGSRPNFYYTTEASSGRWTLDEITVSLQLPAPDEALIYAVSQSIWFHYVPALQCFAYFPGDYGSLRSAQVRRCVYLIKPY